MNEKESSKNMKRKERKLLSRAGDSYTSIRSAVGTLFHIMKFGILRALACIFECSTLNTLMYFVWCLQFRSCCNITYVCSISINLPQ